MPDIPDIPDDVIEAAAEDAWKADTEIRKTTPGWTWEDYAKTAEIYLSALSTATVAAFARAHGLRVAWPDQEIIPKSVWARARVLGEDEVVVHKKLFASLKAFRDIIEAGLLDEPTAAMKKWLDLLAAAERQEADDEAE